MKRKTFTVMMVTLLCSCIAFTSCIGSFKLSNKVLSWNKQVSNSKFVNEVVFFCFWVIPVYNRRCFGRQQHRVLERRQSSGRN